VSHRLLLPHRMTKTIKAAFAFGFLGSCAAAQQYVISTFAGGPVSPQLVRTASLEYPSAVVADPTGAVYISSASLNSVFKLDPSGTIMRVAGDGSHSGYSGDGGPAITASMSLSEIGIASPGGLALDNAGNLFIADTGNHRIRRVSPSGAITTVAGTGHPGFFGDGGPAVNADLYLPVGIAVDRNGNLFVAERGNHLVRRISASGIITTVAGGASPEYNFYQGSSGQFVGDGGPATKATLIGPAGLAVDGAGNLFIADSYNNRVRMVGPDGIITTIAGSGAAGFSGDGASALNAQLSFPIGVALDATGNLLILQLGRVRKVSADGTITTIAGNSNAGFSGDGGPAISAGFRNPFAIATDSANNVYIADTGNNRVRKISPDGTIVTAAGGDVLALGDGGPATNAHLGPFAVAADGPGNVFISDMSHTSIRRVSPSGTITTVAGNGTSGFSGDGGLAINAQLSSPTALALDMAGNLFFADGGTRIRKISTDGTINTVAGNGTMGFTSGLGDGGPAISASLSGFVGGLAIDGAGNLFIADTNNGRVRKVSTDGMIRTVAGGGTNYDDGILATDTALDPWGIVVDDGGNLFIASRSASHVRKVSPSGIITTVAGKTDSFSMSGDGGPAIYALIPAPTGLALDHAGNLFIADNYIDDFGPQPCCDNRIRKISPDGIITTVAGVGVQGYSGDGGPATTAVLNGPTGVAVDAAGNVYVADYFNGVVRLLQPTGRSLLIGGVVNAASQQADTISPGEIVVVYGAGLGPAQLVQNQVSAGVLGTMLSGTTVSFGGIAAPILYTSATQVATVVPYGISGIQAQVVVTYLGNISNSFPIAVTQASPDFFTMNQQGWGQAASINAKDGTVNTASNPAKIGDYISLFATGEGQTSPVGVDGKLGSSTPATPILAVHVSVGGIPALVQYAGSVAGQVAGLMQVNIKIPDGVQPGGYVPIVISMGDSSSAADTVWIAVSAN
jgi:uncharacterized protein (TIGR03437 family)